jgi:hypothetical protein
VDATGLVEERDRARERLLSDRRDLAFVTLEPGDHLARARGRCGLHATLPRLDLGRAGPLALQRLIELGRHRLERRELALGCAELGAERRELRRLLGLLGLERLDALFTLRELAHLRGERCLGHGRALGALRRLLLVGLERRFEAREASALLLGRALARAQLVASGGQIRLSPCPALFCLERAGFERAQRRAALLALLLGARELLLGGIGTASREHHLLVELCVGRLARLEPVACRLELGPPFPQGRLELGDVALEALARVVVAPSGRSRPQPDFELRHTLCKALCQRVCPLSLGLRLCVPRAERVEVGLRRGRGVRHLCDWPLPLGSAEVVRRRCPSSARGSRLGGRLEVMLAKYAQRALANEASSVAWSGRATPRA